jgi:hypothetical protein
LAKYRKKETGGQGDKGTRGQGDKETRGRGEEGRSGCYGAVRFQVAIVETHPLPFSSFFFY